MNGLEHTANPTTLLPDRWQTLFFEEANTPVVSSTTGMQIAWLFGPAAFLLMLFRLMESSLLNTGGQMPLDSLLLGLAPPPFFVLLLTIALGLLVRRAWPHIRPMWIVTGTLLLAGALLAATAALLPPWLDGWISARGFEVIRWDLLVLVLLATGFALLLDRVQGRARAAIVVLMRGLVALLLWLPVVELGGILALGAAPDWPLLVYSFANLRELAPVLASEAQPVKLVLLGLPPLAVLLPAGVKWLYARHAEAASHPASIQATRFLGAVLPLVLLLTILPSTSLPATHRTISYAGMARSVAAYVAPQPNAISTTTNAPFDAVHLRLVPTDSTRRLNVVVILLESFRSRSVTPYTPDLDTTPFLDSLAQDGLLIEDMAAVVPYTNKSLAPILAGIYPEQSYLVVESEWLPGTGLPALLRPFGYRTAFFTPATLDFERKDRLLTQLGFETMRGDGAFSTEGFHKTGYLGYEDRVILKPTLGWVDEALRADDPFFLTLLTLTAHHDYETPPGFPTRRYVAEEKLNRYLNALHYTDDFLRDLFAAFEARGLFDDTLFILLGDHGEAFGEHGLWTHGDVIWNEALHIPALLYGPGVLPERGLINGARQYIDVLPTVTDVLGYRLEGGRLPGHSLMRLVPADRSLYHHTRDGHKSLALRRDSLKFIYHHRRRPMEVYNIRNDPLETNDLADKISPERLKAVEIELLLWRNGVQRRYNRVHTAP